jgi:hypothetical protein
MLIKTSMELEGTEFGLGTILFWNVCVLHRCIQVYDKSTGIQENNFRAFGQVLFPEGNISLNFGSQWEQNFYVEENCCRTIQLCDYPIKQKRLSLTYGFGFASFLQILNENALYLISVQDLLTGDASSFARHESGHVKYLPPVCHELISQDGYGWVRRGVLFSKQG